MLTRRSFVGGTGAALALRSVLSHAGEAQPFVRFVERRTEPAILRPDANHIVAEGLGADDALRLGRTSPGTLHLVNALSESVTPEWRGRRGAGNLDHPALALGPGATGGLPLETLDPGTVLLRAAPSPTHPAARGAQAVIVVNDDRDPPVDRDLVLHLGDWLLTAAGKPVFGSVPPDSAKTGIMTVNGRTEPRTLALAPRSRVRLRLVNGSVQRLMVVSCTGARLMIAAIDGQPSDLFAPARNTVPIGPGARYDLLFDMPEQSGGAVCFSLKPTLTIAGQIEPDRDLMVLRADGAPLPPKPPIVALPANAALPTRIPLEAARRVELIVDGQVAGPAMPPGRWSIAPRPGFPTDRPVLSVDRGAAVTLGFTNATTALVPLRIGGHSVRLLHDRDDGWEPYWRDTLLLPPKGRVHVAFVADSPGRWPIDSGFDDLTLAGLSCFFTVRPR